jgi:hypothetical protein
VVQPLQCVFHPSTFDLQNSFSFELPPAPFISPRGNRTENILKKMLPNSLPVANFPNNNFNKFSFKKLT